MTRARRARAGTLAIGAFLAARAAGAACPASLTAWEFEGGFGDDETWTVRILEVASDRARIEELAVRSAVPRYPVSEYRWFAPDDPTPEPYDLTVVTRTLLGKKLDDLCADLDAAGVGPITARAGLERSASVVETRAGLRLGLLAGSPGVAARPPTDETPATAGSIEDRRQIDLTPILLPDTFVDDPEPTLRAAAERRLSDDRDRDALTRVSAIVESLARSYRARAGEHADVPAARRILDRIRVLDGQALPEGMPSEFRLTAAVASRDYVVATALETIDRPDDPDRRAALRLLGDQSAPSTTEDLVLVLRQQPTTPEKRDEIALALRALVRADDDQARFAALGFLRGPKRTARAALGVFALTEPGLRRDLIALDLDDDVAFGTMVERVRRHVATTARDAALRRAAMGM